MKNLRIIELGRSVTDSNDNDAKRLSSELSGRGLTLVNLMSSPGSGKTTLLKRLIADFKGELQLGVVEADIDSAVDAERIENAGARALQVHTGGMCHVDAGMMAAALEEMDLEGLDLVFLENVGNLICPAEYATGAQIDAMILSIPEGDDKPLKYPLMFRKADVLIVTKTDALPYFNFDMSALRKRVEALHPGMPVFPVSAKTGEGMDALEDWFRQHLVTVKNK